MILDVSFDFVIRMNNIVWRTPSIEHHFLIQEKHCGGTVESFSSFSPPETNLFGLIEKLLDLTVERRALVETMIRRSVQAVRNLDIMVALPWKKRATSRRGRCVVYCAVHIPNVMHGHTTHQHTKSIPRPQNGVISRVPSSLTSVHLTTAWFQGKKVVMQVRLCGALMAAK